MKKLVFLLVTSVLLFSSCEDKDEKIKDSSILGNWGLVEVLSDPGNGSGRFYKVNSTKTIEFHNDGTISSNGSICSMSIDANEPSHGTFSLVDSTINSENCLQSPLKIRFKLLDSCLIINYPCDEPCSAKFKKE